MRLPADQTAYHRLRIAGIFKRSISARDRKIQIANYIIQNEMVLGTSFIVSDPDRNLYLMLGATHEIVPMPRQGRGGDAIFSYIHQMYGLTEREDSSRVVYDTIRSFAIQQGQKVELRRFSAYKADTQTAYVSGYNGYTWKLEGHPNIQKITNGDDGVFFIDDDNGKPCDLDIGPHGLLIDRLTDLNFGEGLSGISGELQRKAIIVWLFAIAFPDLMPTKPLLMIEGAPGSGKCLGRGTPVLCYDGTTKLVEDVQVGDQLMGPDSEPRRVLSTTSGRDQMFKIVPTKGDPWTCNSEHILTLVGSHSNNVIDIPIKEFVSKSNYFKLEHKQFMVGVDFAPSKPLPIDPYFLGVWYGDGTKTSKPHLGITGVVITKPDAEIEALAYATAKDWGLEVRKFLNTSGCPSYAISTGNHVGQVRYDRNPLLNAMRVVVGDLSSLPHEYLTASREDRLKFLAGFLDTDGYFQCGYYEIVQKNRGFADGICFLARSLGYRAAMIAKYVPGYEAPYWRVTISGDMTDLPMRIERKKPTVRKQIKDVRRTGIEIEAIGEGDYNGFTLDGDGRFLLGDFTVTHNSLSLQLFQWMLLGDVKPLSISKSQEDDFGVLILRNPIALLDNLDSYIEWVADKVCSYTTTGFFTKRRLYSDDEEVIIKPHSFIAVASKNPASFRREDVVDRSIIIRLERRHTFVRAEKLIEGIKHDRPKLLGEYLYYVNEMVLAIREGAYKDTDEEAHRMGDYAALARVVGKVLGWADEEVVELMRGLQNERDTFAAEEDPLTEVLHKWIAYRPHMGPSNIGRDVSAHNLFSELETIAQANGIQWYKSVKTLTQKIRSPHVDKDFIVQTLAADGHKSFRIWRKSDAQLSIVPDVEEPPVEVG